MTRPAFAKKPISAAPFKIPSFLNPDRRIADRPSDRKLVKLLPGEHYVTAADEMIVTVLGSCVSACVRDPYAGIGGMNHFMLSKSTDGIWAGVSASLRYGNFAMERLINDVLRHGGQRSRLEIKVFGGANVLQMNTAIGSQNAEFVETYLEAEGLQIAARHLYGRHPRRIQYFPATGVVQMLELYREDDLAVVGEEVRYGERLLETPLTGSVELFE